MSDQPIERPIFGPTGHGAAPMLPPSLNVPDVDGRLPPAPRGRAALGLDPRRGGVRNETGMAPRS